MPEWALSAGDPLPCGENSGPVSAISASIVRNRRPVTHNSRFLVVVSVSLNPDPSVPCRHFFSNEYQQTGYAERGI
jgi:hypothetical protein